MWLEMIIDKRLLLPENFREVKRLMNEADELTSIFIATRKTIENKRKL